MDYNNRDDITIYIESIEKYGLLTKKEEKECALKIQQGDERAKGKLINSNLRLVINVAKKYTNCGVPLLDLIQEGNLGLIRAAIKFDVSKGFRFSTYATWWIRQYIVRSITDKKRIIRIPCHLVEVINKIKKIKKDIKNEDSDDLSVEALSKKMGIPIIKVITAIDAMDLGDAISMSSIIHDGNTELTIEGVVYHKNNINLDKKFLIKKINKVLDEYIEDGTLTKRNKEIFIQRFGLFNEVTDSKTLEEVGQKYDLTRERIRQITDKILRKLRANKNLRNRFKSLI